MKIWIPLIALLLCAPATLRAGDRYASLPEGGLVDMEALYPSEEGLVRIEVAGVDARDFLARFVGDTLFISYTAFCDFLRIKNSVSPDLMTMQGELQAIGTFTLSRTSGTIEIGGRTLTLPPQAVRVVADELYIEQSVLTGALGVTAYYDVQNLKLRISPDDRLPVVQWKRSQERYGLIPSTQSEAGRGVEVPIDRQAFGAPTLNWTLSNTTNGQASTSVGALYLGQQFLWGTLELNGSSTFESGVERNMHASLNGVRWTYQLPTSPVVRQIQLGTYEVAGKRLHGATVSNTPLSPRAGYGTYELQGRSQPGWTVELYDGNRLVDVTRADSLGRYSFQLLMSYGTIDRVTRQVGPYGEVVIEQHRMQFNQSMIPAGEMEYAVNYGLDSIRTESGAQGNARVAVGLLDRLTIGAEASYRTPRAGQWVADSVMPRALASVWLGESSSLWLGYAIRTGLLSGEFYTVGSTNGVLRVAVDSFAVKDRTFASSLEANLPIGPLSIGGRGGFTRRTWGNEYAAEPQISGYAGGISFVGSTRFTWAQAATGEIASALDTLPRKRTESSLRVMVTPVAGLLVSAHAAYDHREERFSGADISAYYRLNDFLGFNLAYSAPELKWKEGTVIAQFSLDLAPMRALVAGSYQNGVAATSTFAQGGAVLSPVGVKFFADPVVGQSAVIVAAFNDRNQNGTRDDGEESLDAPAARLSFAGSEMATDDGIFRLLPANRECRVEVDRWSYAGDDLYPSRTEYMIYTLPSGVHVMEVPFARGFDITGRCSVAGDSARPAATAAFLNGLRVRMTAISGGAVYDGEVFSDGTVFVAGVSSGSYRLEFEPEQLAARRICPPAEPVQVTIDNTTHRIPAIELQRCR